MNKNRSLSIIFCLFIVTPAAFAQTELAAEAELFQGKAYSNAFSNPIDRPDHPNVLLIGDSISIGYTVETRKQLAAHADVFRVPSNAKHTSFGVKKLTTWLKTKKWDVIHFNWGLWDICYRNPNAKTQGHRDKVNGTLTTSPELYQNNLENILAQLQKTKAKLIWASTTPVPDHEIGRYQGDEIKYNKIAHKIMSKHGVKINDLHQHVLNSPQKIQRAKGDVHFTQAGSHYLAEKVASSIKEVL